MSNSSGEGIGRLLRAIGVGPDMPSLREISEDEPKKNYFAFCDSIRCQRKYLGRKIKKNVPKRTRMCPDCGHALFWEEEKRKK